MDNWSLVIQMAKAGDEDSQTIVASAYIYSKLTPPLDMSARRLYVKNLLIYEWNETLPVDDTYGRKVTEAVVKRFLDGVGTDGQRSSYARKLYSPAMNQLSYKGKQRLIDEYFLCWDLAALYYKEGDFVAAGELFGSVLRLQPSFSTIPAISQVPGNDACDLSEREMSICFYHRGKASERGLNGFDVDYRDAEYYYDLSSQAGNAAAKYALGVMLYEGKPGVEKNLPKSRRLMEEAADAGNKNAEDFLETAEYPSKKPQVVNIHVEKIDVDKGVRVGNGNFINESTLNGG